MDRKIPLLTNNICGATVKRNQYPIMAVAPIPFSFDFGIANRIVLFEIISAIVHGNTQRSPPKYFSLGSKRHVPVIRYFDIPHEALMTDNANFIQKK